MNREIRADIYTRPCVKLLASGKLPYNRKLSSVLCNDLGVGRGECEGVQEGRNTRIHTADSLHWDSRN